MNDEQFWQYNAFSGLIFQYPSEEIAVFHADANSDSIVFIASLHDLQKYPHREGNKIFFGPNVFREGHVVTIDGKAYQQYPLRVGKKTVLGPSTVLENHVVTVNRTMFYQICGAPVIERSSICIMPYKHRSNQHEDKEGNTRYA